MPFLLFLLALILAGCSSPPPSHIRLVSFQGAEAPLLARKLGLFEKAGLQVDMDEMAGNAKSMEALLGGSADSIIGTYEQTILLQAMHQNVVAYRLLTECHCLALIVPPAKAKQIRQIKDLAGRTIGVGAPGGSMQSFAEYLLQKEGAASASYAGIGVGATAFAAIEGARVDAAVVLVSTLVRLRERYPDLLVLAETLSEAGSQHAFGFSKFPSMALLARGEWLQQHPREAQQLSGALGDAVTWIRTHPASAVRDALGATLDLRALELHLPRYSATGLFDPGPAQFVRQQLINAGKVPPSAVPSIQTTYTNQFVKRDSLP